MYTTTTIQKRCFQFLFLDRLFKSLRETANFLPPADGQTHLDHHWSPHKQGQRHRHSGGWTIVFPAEQGGNILAAYWWNYVRSCCLCCACSKNKQVGSVLNICQSFIFHKSLSLMENHLKPSIAPEIPLKSSDFLWMCFHQSAKSGPNTAIGHQQKAKWEAIQQLLEHRFN